MCSDEEWENTSTPGGSTGTQGKTKFIRFDPLILSFCNILKELESLL